MYFGIILLKPEQMETPNLSLLPTSAIENRDYVQRRGNDPFTQDAWEDQHDDDHTL